MNTTMNVKRRAPDPWLMARTFFWGYAWPIIGSAAFLAALYLLVGLDPTIPVSAYMVDAVGVTMPLAGQLAAIWLLYCVFYLSLGPFDHDLRIAGLFLARTVRFWRHQAFRPWIGSDVAVCGATPPSLLRLRHWCLPMWLAVGWRAGNSEQLE